jgi:undecaprenyl-diphosphatase
MAGAHPFDDAVERFAQRIRSPRLDPLFFGLSSAADHGLLWFALGSLRAARHGDPTIALRLAAALGAESGLTNGPIKLLFRRLRPVHESVAPDVELPYGLHRPVTSSFPSGHATSAFTAASLLGQGRRTQPLYYALAALVGFSRVYVRLHHGSDVVAGTALGLGFGRIARRVVPLEPSGPTTPAG